MKSDRIGEKETSYQFPKSKKQQKTVLPENQDLHTIKKKKKINIKNRRLKQNKFFFYFFISTTLETSKDKDGGPERFSLDADFLRAIAQKGRWRL